MEEEQASHQLGPIRLVLVLLLLLSSSSRRRRRRRGCSASHQGLLGPSTILEILIAIVMD